MKKSNRTILISVLSILIAMLMVLSLAACGSEDDKNTETKATEIATQLETESETEIVLATESDNATATEAPADNTSDNGAEVVSNDELVIPDVTGIWKNENDPKNYSVEVTSQNGNTIDFTVTAIRGNGSQIATSKISVTLETSDETGMVRGYADFEYVDSFQTGGVGSISVSENVITLVIEQEFNDGGRWSIAHATGDYIRG